MGLNVSPHGSKSVVLSRPGAPGGRGRGGGMMGFGNIDLGAVRLKKSAPAAATTAAASGEKASTPPTSPAVTEHRSLLRTHSSPGLAAAPTSPSGRASPSGSGSLRGSPAGAGSSSALDGLLQWCKSIAEKYDGVTGTSSLSLSFRFLSLPPPPRVCRS
jgi:hypothetical protein